MTDKKKPKDPGLSQTDKLKGIIRNQILEIKKLKEEQIKLASKSVGQKSNPTNEKAFKTKISELQSKINELQAKLANNLKAKDLIIQALKKDLKSSQREIEGHLKRHNDELRDLHESIQKERLSRDFLLGNITQELVAAIKNTSSSNKGPANVKDKEDLEREKLIKPQIKTVHIPEKLTQVKKDKLTILYIAPNIPNFDESSGGKRAYLMLKLLAQDHNVYCYSRNLGKQTHKDILEAEGITVLTQVQQNHIIEKLKNIDVIIAAWFFTYFDYNRIINHYTDARLIIDSVDIHWVREERSLGTWEGISPQKQEENKKSEIQVYEKADIIWVVSEEDKKALKKEIPGADVRIVSNIHIMKEDSYVKDKENNILFFGGYNHYPNINAAKILAKQIFPAILKKVPDAKLILAGSNAPVEIEELGELEGVEYRGYINFADISKLYAESKVTIVPLTEGAGIKGKICEAIEYRTPAITNDIGNEGIGLETGIDGFVSNNYEDLIQHGIDVLSDKYNLEEITLKAQQKVESILGMETNKREMIESMIPVVDICIVTYNKKGLLKTCVDSIIKNTRYPHYNILIYSNGCADGTVKYMQTLEKKHDNIHGIYADTNDVFVRPNNTMMKYNLSHDVVLVNNDVQVTEGWLEALVKEAYQSRQTGIVGSKILYPDNTLQEFGSELYASGSGMNIGKNDDPNKPEYMRSKKASYVSGCSMYIKRATINRIGTFDLQFAPCYAEDSDYCYTAWTKGIETNVTPHSIIYHMEGASSGTDTSSGFKRFQTINIQKFLAKHGNDIANINSKVHNFNEEFPFLK